MNLTRERAHALGLHGLLSNWDQAPETDWIPWLLSVEEAERGRRSLERRLAAARLGRYKPLADFDWSWPSKADRAQIDALFTLDFVNEGANIVMVGPNGVGKTCLSKNLCQRALEVGHTVLFTTASSMLNALASEDSVSALERRLRRLCSPKVLCIDEVGYLSYGNRHADLLFEVVTRRYERGKPIIITTNKAFRDWSEVFPNATCVVTLVDRLIHRSEVVTIQGESFRLKESKERRRERERERRGKDSSKDDDD